VGARAQYLVVEPCVYALVLNWNGAKFSVHALESLRSSRYANLHVLLVDNGSDASDLAELQARFPDVAYLALGANHGFGRAVNLGFAEAMRCGAEHVLLFNNDAVLPPGVPVVERLVAELCGSPGVALTAPIVIGDARRMRVQSAGIALRPFFPAPRGVAKGLPYERARTRTFRYDFLEGSCLLVRGAAFAAVNGMDPDYFFHLEDADLMIRLKRAGYTSKLVTDAYVIHRRSSSLRRGSAAAHYASIRSKLIFVKKHARWYGLPAAAVTMIGVSLAFVVLGLVQQRRWCIVPIAKAWRDFFRGRWGGHDGAWPDGYAQPAFALRD
jgi:GT2 family glycosyltransferase